MQEPNIQLELNYGTHGEKHQRLAVNIPAELMQELLEPVEFNSTFSEGRETLARTHKRVFGLRKTQAEKLSAEFTKALLEIFGVNDTLGGYKISEMSIEEKAYHRLKGRI